MLGWYWYVLWSVFACFHWQTRHDTYQYQHMTAQVVLVCIDTCIRYVFVRITWFVLQIRYDTYFLQPATSGQAAACAPACLRFLWGLECMCHTVGISCAWLRGHVLAQGDRQRALSCFLGRLTRGRQHSASPLRVSPPSAFQIQVQCCPQHWEHTGNKVGPSGRAERRKGAVYVWARVCIGMYVNVLVCIAGVLVCIYM
jgi:hypothetical protein